MNNQSSAEDDVPVWARSSAFLLKPDSSPYGFIDTKGRKHLAQSAAELAEKLDSSTFSFDFLWTPDSERLVVPEQLELAHKPLRKRQRKHADLEITNGLRMSALFGAMLLWTTYAAWQNSGGRLEAIYSNQISGVSALLLLIFGLIPLYQGWKLRRHLNTTRSSCLLGEVPEAQFDAWLAGQKVPVTYFLIACISACLLTQLLIEFGSFSFHESVLNAGLLKREALKYPEVADGLASWRFLTAPMLHGNVIHFLMNAGGILYLGRRIELLARWPHLLIVFVVSMWVGSLATYQWEPEKISVGASGGLMGLLGFLLIFEILHPRLVPRPAMRRLLAGLLLVIVTGVLGVSFIDNAAHAGGLLGGVIYAAIVFPRSASFRRPASIQRDQVSGYLAALMLTVITIFSVLKILA
ncbi:MAG: rhomboid family intramembrane serine protease [Akkermansiaceae bacterium]